jgi:hypothetical protein
VIVGTEGRAIFPLLLSRCFSSFMLYERDVQRPSAGLDPHSPHFGTQAATGMDQYARAYNATVKELCTSGSPFNQMEAAAFALGHLAGAIRGSAPAAQSEQITLVHFNDV